LKLVALVWFEVQRYSKCIRIGLAKLPLSFWIKFENKTLVKLIQDVNDKAKTIEVKLLDPSEGGLQKLTTT